MGGLGQTKNYFHDMAADFWNGKIIVSGKEYPVGALSCEMLNCTDTEVNALVFEAAKLSQCFGRFSMLTAVTPPDALALCEILKRMNRLMIKLPVYKRFQIDMSMHDRMPQELSDPEVCKQLSNHTSPEFFALQNHIVSYLASPPGLQNFKRYIGNMEDKILSKLEKRDANHYAQNVSTFFLNDMFVNNAAFVDYDKLSDMFLPFHEVNISYAACEHPNGKGEKILVERIFFSNLDSFLAVDFFKGLQCGNAPIKCQNCGRYFLNQDGFHRVYCEGNDPKQPQFTCYQSATENGNKEPANEIPSLRRCTSARNKFWAEFNRKHITKHDYDRVKKEINRVRDKAKREGLSADEVDSLLDRTAVYKRLKIKRV